MTTIREHILIKSKMISSGFSRELNKGIEREILSNYITCYMGLLWNVCYPYNLVKKKECI